MSIENRLAAKKRAKQAKAKRIRKRVYTVIGICLIPVVICLIAFLIMMNRIEKTASPSSYIREDGTIKARAAKNYVTMVDYKNITINREENLPTESEVQNTIDSTLKANTKTVTEAGTEITAGSTVALTYKVTVDGAEVAELASDGKSYTLGSNRFTEDFDATILGLLVGDEFAVTITFEADYSNEALAGKTATFDGKVDSIDVVPELTDDFVAETLKTEMEGSGYALTAEGYRNFVANNLFENKLKSAVDTYIEENTKANSYPLFYTKAQYYVADQNYISYMNYYNQMFGQTMYQAPKDMLGIETDKEYTKRLKEDSRNNAKYYLGYQAIYEDAGLPKITEADVKAFAAENGDYDSMVENYGYNYLAQMTLRQKTFDYVMTLVKVDGDATKMWVPDTATQADAK